MLNWSGLQQSAPAQGSTETAPRLADVAKGDFRGRYGYGRPAYRTDPNASYRIELPRPFSIKR